MDEAARLKELLRPLQALVPPIEGGCVCGAVAYVCTAVPVWSGNCHCRSCQKLSGGPFVSAFSVPAESFSLQGETTAFRRTAESGHLVTTTHCASCGARVCAQSAGNTALVNVFAATLRDVAAYTPISNVYLSEAAHWVTPPAAPVNFDRMPERPKRPG